MRKSRRDSTAFNPGKVLAKGAPKKPSMASVQRMTSLCRAVVMEEGLKKMLYAEFEKENPEVFLRGAIIGSEENLELAEDFIRRAFARKKLTFSDEIFAALFLDFLRGFVRWWCLISPLMSEQPSNDRPKFNVVWIGLGVAIGAAVGGATNNLPLGVGIGIAIGVALAAVTGRRQ
jgi:hypothetical protein